MKEISVSVTSLSQYLSRSGDIAGGSYQSVSGIEGTRLHQKVFSELQKQYGDVVTTEEQLSWVYDDLPGLNLRVQGRFDAMLEEKNKAPRIFEIKSFNSAKDSFKSLVRPEHITQLKLYGAMYIFANSNVMDVTLTLRYVSVTTFKAYEESYSMSYEEAESFFESVCMEYAVFAKRLLDYGSEMMTSVKAASFPYDTIRSGQKEFMKKALLSLTSGSTLFVEAPTGIGKTISTLYPAIKGLQRGRYEKIFYLTAKAATRDVACKALNDMRSKGLLIRSILLQSKEKMCPFGTECDAKFCPLAKNYYGRLKPALEEILTKDEITPDIVTEIAGNYGICPHEFMIDTMAFCTVVIGDYNHIFHPRVKLMTDDPGEPRCAVLVDEAHNMIDRGRDMFSASFSLSLIDEMIKDFKDRDTRISALIHQLRQYFVTASQLFMNNSSCFSVLEEAEERKIIRTEGWEAMRQPPRKLYAKMWYTVKCLGDVLDGIEQGQTRRTAMKFFFEARYFLTVLEHYFDDSYITTIGKDRTDIVLTLNCLDCSSKLDNIIRDKLPVIFFSATLSPFEYYKNCLVGRNAGYTSTLQLPSPFPPENLEIMIDTEISTAYKNRDATRNDLAAKITDALIGMTGNYMVFFPSFEYMNQIMPIVSEKLGADGKNKDAVPCRIVSQFPEMTEKDKAEYLSSFSEASKGLLIGTAVLGGHFGEGIDLVGDRLSGVIIVGVGLPKVTPERQILLNYYTEKFGDGFAFAYRFPGWQKVLQAVGRVIRTEEDTGFALLIDSRLENPEYVMLFPDHWRI